MKKKDICTEVSAFEPPGFQNIKMSLCMYISLCRTEIFIFTKTRNVSSCPNLLQVLSDRLYM